jgi:hypothetical protein
MCPPIPCPPIPAFYREKEGRGEHCRAEAFVRGDGRYHLLVVDERGAVKACSRDRFPLPEALRLVERLPLQVAMPGQGELWRLLQEEDLRKDAREHGLHVEV